MPLGYIYKLTLIPDKEPTNIEHYYGSTMDHEDRLKQHRNVYNNIFNRKYYPITVTMKVLEVVENCVSHTDEKLRKREQEYIDSYECINSSHRAWAGDHKRKISEKEKEGQKKYIETHKEEVKEYQAEYRNIPENKERKKELQQTHKERRKKERQRLVSCRACKKEMTYGCLDRHTTTKKHINNLTN
tara:strand:+ start:489 stop:1049 length:561 start_codon:yes stop_codon:yes gene_type:complete